MRSVADSLRYGKNKYYQEYSKAIKKLWEHELTICDVPIECWFIAQATQESRFNAMSISPVGAKGIAQFMPETAKEIGRELFIRKIIHREFDPLNTVQSIYGQVLYMNNLFKIWKAKRSAYSRMLLALASYNAGVGNILECQKRAKNVRHWVEMRHELRNVTGKHSKETLGYVDNILNYALICEVV